MICLGIDQSFTQTGIAVVQGNSSNDAELLFCDSINFSGCHSKTESRNEIKKYISDLTKKYNCDIICCERIRLFSQKFISQDYIKSTASLIACIVDVLYPHTIYSVDTASWKARICGHKKGNKKGDKDVSVRYIFNRFNMVLNDDTADAICIALYGLDYEKNKKLLKVET